MLGKALVMLVVGVLASTATTAGMAAPQREAGSSQLIQAVRQGHVSRVRQLVRSGVGVDGALPGDGTALIVASGRGDLQALNEFPGPGAKLSARR